MECEVCGRRIKSPKSIERGIGPGCWEKMQAKVGKVKGVKKEAAGPIECGIPGQMNLEEVLAVMEESK